MKTYQRLVTKGLVVAGIGVAALGRPRTAHASGLCNTFCAQACSAAWTKGCYATGPDTCDGNVTTTFCEATGECASYNLFTIYCGN
jgi:hypothetical protein